MCRHISTGSRVRRYSVVGLAIAAPALILFAATVPSAATPTAAPADAYVKCTDRIDYTGDPRPNVEINMLGEGLGYCPTPLHPTDGYLKCTDRIDYGRDPRPNADINLLGEQLGECPQPSY